MTITDLVLILFILVLLAFAIYDQFIMPRRNGPVLLAIPLLRRNRVDGIIFVGLIAILIYNNIANHGELITTWFNPAVRANLSFPSFCKRSSTPITSL